MKVYWWRLLGMMLIMAGYTLVPEAWRYAYFGFWVGALTPRIYESRPNPRVRTIADAREDLTTALYDSATRSLR